MSILSVSRDPGELIVFLGYALLLGGMSTVFGTRIAQRRARGGGGLRRRRRAPPRRSHRSPRPALARRRRRSLWRPSSWAAASATAVRAAEVPSASLVAQLRTLPVQHDGRVMPLDTLARQAVFEVTGEKGSFQGYDPVAMVLGWSFDAQAWAGEPVVRIGSPHLAEAAGLPGARYASFRTLLASDRVRELIQRAHARSDAGERPTSLEKDAQNLEGRLLWMQGFLTHDSLQAVALPGDPQAAWSVPAALSSPAGLLDAERNQRSARIPGYSTAAEMAREVRYNARAADGAGLVDPGAHGAPGDRRLGAAAALAGRRLGGRPGGGLRGDDLGHRRALGGRRPHPGIEHVRVDALPRLGRRPVRPDRRGGASGTVW